MHWSQMYTPGPATSLRTCSCPLPQKEQRVWRLRSSRSFMAPSGLLSLSPRRGAAAVRRGTAATVAAVAGRPRAARGERRSTVGVEAVAAGAQVVDQPLGPAPLARPEKSPLDAPLAP